MWIPTIFAFLAIMGGSSSIENHIVKSAQAYNLPVNLVMGIAICESGLNPKILNPIDTDGLPAKGLFQFKDRTFSRMGGKNIWNYKEQTEIALKMMKDDRWLEWPECFKKTIKEVNDYNLSLFYF